MSPRRRVDPASRTLQLRADAAEMIDHAVGDLQAASGMLSWLEGESTYPFDATTARTVMTEAVKLLRELAGAIRP